MGLIDVKQHKILSIDDSCRLIEGSQIDWSIALPWYQDEEILYYSEGITDRVYEMEDIERMYQYLSGIGELYFIQLLEGGKWITVGDATLAESNMPIVIGDERCRGHGLGKRVIEALVVRAKEIGFERLVIPEIYDYNLRSKRLFESLGFVEVSDNGKSKSYALDLLDEVE